MSVEGKPHVCVPAVKETKDAEDEFDVIVLAGKEPRWLNDLGVRYLHLRDAQSFIIA